MRTALDPRAYKTYSVLTPLATHWRKATCAEVDCPYYVHGYRVRAEHCDEQLLHLIRTCGKRYTELHVREGETYFEFEPGQPCFHAAEHRMQLERPELYVIRDGDQRGNPTGRRDQVSGTTWNDDFGEHQETLADAQKEG